MPHQHREKSHSPDPDRPLMYNLGAFFGEVIRAVNTPVESSASPRARRVVREAEVQTHDGGVVKVRRTVIDEVDPG